MKYQSWGVELFLCATAIALSSSVIGSRSPGLRTEVLATNHLTILVTTYYGISGWTSFDAEIRSEWKEQPLEIDITPWSNSED